MPSHLVFQDFSTTPSILISSGMPSLCKLINTFAWRAAERLYTCESLGRDSFGIGTQWKRMSQRMMGISKIPLVLVMEGRFHWYLKIHFPQSNAVYSERFPDDKRLDHILNDYIHPSESDPVKRQKLKLYVHSPRDDIRVFLKAEQQHNSLRFLELDLKKSLQENLMHKTIVEYPEVFVVLKQHSQEFLAHTPERSGARVSSSPDRLRSGVSKRPKVVPEDEELEDGEVRSDQEEEDTEGDDGNLAETESKVTVTHHDDDDDDGGEEEAKTNQKQEMMMVSGDVDGQDCTETFSDSQNVPGLPDENRNVDSVAQQEMEAQHDSSQTCVDGGQSSSRDPSDAGETEGQKNTHDASNIYSSESHISADVTLV
ncbi:hypothetical protein PO909_014519 [Leuciscus waleckii]